MLGTSSSEAALPRMMTKLENAGCGQSVVGLVMPAGYSFNLDGTSIYLTIAAIFIAQATNVHAVPGRANRHPGRAAADLEGRGGGDRRRLHHAGRHARSTGKVPVAGLALCWVSTVSCPRQGPSPT